MSARCTGFSTEGIWIARLSIDSTLFRTIGGRAGAAVAALAKTEIVSFGKLLLKKFSRGVDATAGGLGEVADVVRIRAWVEAGLGASGPGFGGFSGAADGIRAVKFNVPCGM